MDLKGRLLFIDGYKGLLCLSVFLFHYYSTFSILFGKTIDCLFANTPLFICIDGVWAVRAFVLLSAFSISLSLSNGKSLAPIIIKRYFRLALPVGAAILIGFGLQYFYHVTEVSALTGNNWIEEFQADYSLKQLIMNLIFCVPVGLNRYCSVAWMIQYIFWGTFLAIIVHEAIKNMRPIKKILFALLFVVISYRISEFYSLIVVGVLLEQNKDLLFKQRSFLFELIPLSTILISVFIYWKLSLGFGSFVSSTLIVTSVLSSRIIRNFFSLRIMGFLGKYSFELFLIHCPIIFSLSSFLFLSNTFGRYNHIILLIITVAVVIIFSVFFKLIVEERLLMPIQKRLSLFFK